MKAIERFIRHILESKKRKNQVIIITIVILLASFLMFPTKFVLAKMLPSKSDNTFTVYIDKPTGSSLEQTKDLSLCVAKQLQKEKNVLDLEIFLAQGSPLDYAGLMKGSAYKHTQDVAEIVVNLTDKHERDESSYAMIHRIRPLITKTCIKDDSKIKFIEQPAGPPTLASIVIELYSQNDAPIPPDLSLKIANVLSKTPQLVDVDILADDVFEKFNLVVNKEKIIRSGLSIEQVNKIIYLAFEGMAISVKNTKDYPSQIPLFLVLSDESKALSSKSEVSLKNKLSSVKLMNAQGMMIPLIEVVDIQKTTSSPPISSKNLRNVVNIIAETDLASQVYPLLEARSRLKKELANDYIVTNGSMFNLRLQDKQTQQIYDVVWDGEMKVTLDTFRDLGAAFITALILIFLLMVIYYKSFILSAIVLAGSFLSIIGVIFGHWFMDLVTSDTFFLTATSLIGFIALMGISSRNSLLLIDFAISLIIDKDMDKTSAIAIATATRSKPIFLTGAAIILASTLLAGDPIFGGLGVALIFGTIAAVVASLIFIPVLMHNAKTLDKDALLELKSS